MQESESLPVKEILPVQEAIKLESCSDDEFEYDDDSNRNLDTSLTRESYRSSSPTFVDNSSPRG
jgi:hypothetical protein